MNTENTNRDGVAKPLRVLVVEDSPKDTELVVREIRRGGFTVTWRRVETDVEMKAALDTESWDVIVSDYSMPHFNGLAALRVLQEKGLDLPFIIVSGTIGEETAVAAMKAGAHDYLMKNNLERLVPAIERKLRDVASRRDRKRAEAALRESEARFRIAQEMSPDGFTILRPVRDAQERVVDFTWVYENPTIARLNGTEPAAVVGRRLLELFPGHRGTPFLKAYQQVAESGETCIFEADYSGESLPKPTSFLIVVVPMAGNIAILAQDITERKRAEDRERLARDVLEVLNRTNNTVNIIRDILLLIKNSTGLEAVGIRLREGDDFPYYTTSGFPERFVKMERYLCERDAAGELVRDSQGNPVLECMCGNILCGRTNPALPFFTKGGSFWSNCTTQLLASYQTRNAEGGTVPSSELRVPTLLGRTRNRCNGEGYESVALIPLRASDQIFGLLQLNDHRRDQFTPEIIHFLEGLGASIGIALARENAADELRFKNSILSTQQEISIDGILVVDENGGIISTNRRFAEMWDIPSDIMASKSDARALQSVTEKLADPEEFIRKVKHLYKAQKETSRDEIALKDGRTFDRYSAPMFGAEERYFGRVWYFRDITERVRAKEALRRYEMAVEQSSDGIAITDEEGRFTFVNIAWARMHGYETTEMIGQSLAIIHNPEPMESDGILISDAVRGKSLNLVEVRHRRKDGTTFPTWMSVTFLKDNQGKPKGLVGIARDITEQKRAEQESQRLSMAMEQAHDIVIVTDHKGTIQYVNPAFTKITGFTREEALGQNPRLLKSGKQDAEFYRRMWAMLAAGETWEGHFINKRKNDTFYEEDATISPVRDTMGKIINYVAVKRDVTNEIQLENQLQQAQKMEAIGRLAGGVAHDFNNMLQVILGNASMILDSTAPDDPRTADLNEIISAARRSADLTRQLLAFARKQTIAPQVLDLNDTIANMLKMLRRLIGEDIDLLWKPGLDLGLVNMDPSQLDQILANLAVNARDAIAGVGKLTIETGNAEFDADYGQPHPEVVPGAYVAGGQR